MQEELPVMGTISGHIGFCHTVYLPQDGFGFLDGIAELSRQRWAVLDG